jgi:hypothetical protein
MTSGGRYYYINYSCQILIKLIIERVGFVAHQFALWVIPCSWWEAEMEPDFTAESVGMSFI